VRIRHTAIVEVVVNAIQAIDAKAVSNGQVLIRAYRSAQLETDGSLPDILSFEIEDNGIATRTGIPSIRSIAISKSGMAVRASVASPV